MKKKILLTASSFPQHEQDNTGIFIKEFCENLSKHYPIIILTHRLKGQQKHEHKDGYQIIRFPFLPFGLFSQSFKHGVFQAFSSSRILFLCLAPCYIFMQFIYTWKIVKKYKINTIHAHWLIPQGFTAVVYKILLNKKIKVISTIHGADVFAFQNKMSMAIKKYVLKHIDVVTVVSHHILHTVSKLTDRQDIHVLPMGINTTLFNKSEESRTLTKNTGETGAALLFVGRLTEKKGLIYLIHAMPDIIKTFPNTKLLIAGNGDQYDTLTTLTAQLKLTESVTFLGSVKHDHLPDLYAKADMFIGPSIIAKSGDSEGLGLVFVEAASSGTLVITSDFPAMADVIRDKETGFTVQQKSASELAETILYALSHPEESNTLSRNAQLDVMKRFDWTFVANNYRQLYHSVHNPKR